MDLKNGIIPPAGKLHNDASGEVFPLQDASVVGRNRDCAVPISDLRVSRRHAMIRCQNDGCWFFDLGSVNGSLINGRRVTTAQLLVNGDLIQIADHCFRFEGGQTGDSPGGGTAITEHTIADVRIYSVHLYSLPLSCFFLF